MIDADDFKKINDGRGHACGDAVLKTRGELLRSSLRQLDVAARWGGEELLVIAEKIRIGAEAVRVRYERGDVGFTVTLGVSTVLAGGPPVEACLGMAGEAHDVGKRAGKNGVVPAAGLTIT